MCEDALIISLWESISVPDHQQETHPFTLDLENLTSIQRLPIRLHQIFHRLFAVSPISLHYLVVNVPGVLRPQLPQRLCESRQAVELGLVRDPLLRLFVQGRR